MKKLLLTIALLCFCLAGAFATTGCGAGDLPKECLFVVLGDLPEHVSVSCNSGVNDKDGCLEGGNIWFYLSFDEGYDIGSIQVKRGDTVLEYESKYGDASSGMQYGYYIENVMENVVISLTGEAQFCVVDFNLSLEDYIFDAPTQEDLDFLSASKLVYKTIRSGVNSQETEVVMGKENIENAFADLSAMEYRYNDKVIIGMYYDNDELQYVHRLPWLNSITISEQRTYMECREVGGKERVVSFVEITLLNDENTSLYLTSADSADDTGTWIYCLDDNGEELLVSKQLMCDLQLNYFGHCTILELVAGERPIVSGLNENSYALRMVKTLAENDKVKINGETVRLVADGSGNYRFRCPLRGMSSLPLPWLMLESDKDYNLQIMGIEEYVAQNDNKILIEMQSPVDSFNVKVDSFAIVQYETLSNQDEGKIYKVYQNVPAVSEYTLEFYLNTEIIVNGGELQVLFDTSEGQYTIDIDLQNMYEQGTEWGANSLDNVFTAKYEGHYLYITYDSSACTLTHVLFDYTAPQA